VVARFGARWTLSEPIDTVGGQWIYVLREAAGAAEERADTFYKSSVALLGRSSTADNAHLADETDAGRFQIREIRVIRGGFADVRKHVPPERRA